MGRANEFFGMDFGAQETSAPAPKEVPKEVKVSHGRAFEFFGKMFGGGDPAPAFKQPSKIGRLDSEAQAVVAAQFTKEEKAQQEVSMRTPESINELKTEIARTKDPKNKAILQDYLIEITGKK